MYLGKYLRILLFTLAVLLSAALPAATAEAKQNDINYGNWIAYENEDGTLTITGCRSISEYMYDKTLTIPSEVEGKKVTGVGFYIGEQQFNIFDHPYEIETLILPDTIEHVDEYQGDERMCVFKGYSGLKKVVMPDNDKFDEEDVERLFNYNSADVKELVCRSDRCMRLGYRYLWADSLETLSLHYISNLFFGFEDRFQNLKSLTIQESENADKILECSGLAALTSLTLPPDVKKLSLEDCPVLTELSLPGSLRRLWLGECPELATLKSEKALKDISIESMYNCPKLFIPVVYLKYVESDESQYIGGGTPFAGSQVQEIHIDSRRIVYGMDKKFFRGTSNLKAIVVEGNASNFFSKDGVLYWRATATDGSGATSNHIFAYPAAKSTSGNLNISPDVSCIYLYALDGCKFSTVTFPENMDPHYEWDYVWDQYLGNKWVSLADFCSAKFRMVKNSSPDEYNEFVGAIPDSRIEYYKGSKYKITYNLSGGKNNSANPSSYTAGEVITLKKPSRAGYTFLGWTRNDSEDAVDYWNTTKRIWGGYFSNYTFTAHWMRITAASKKVAAGKSIQLTAEITPTDKKNPSVTWSSSNEKVATVSKKGVVTFKKNTGGKSVTITASVKGGKKATFKLTSMKGVVKKVKLSGKSSLKAGKSTTLKAKVTASSKANKALSWSSSNTKYATVSSKGKVTAKKAGKGKKVTITAKATDGSGKKATFKITIK